MIPPFNNLLIELLKGTALVSVMGVGDTDLRRQPGAARAAGERADLHVILLMLTSCSPSCSRAACARWSVTRRPGSVRRTAEERLVTRKLGASAGAPGRRPGRRRYVMNWDWAAVGDFMPRFWDGLLRHPAGPGPRLADLLRARPGLGAGSRSVRRCLGALAGDGGHGVHPQHPAAGAAVLPLLRAAGVGTSTFSALTTGIIAIGLHYSTYTAAGLPRRYRGVPVGQWEAATALSLPRTRTWSAVILPQAIRRVVPALGNYVIAMLKDTPMLAVDRRAGDARRGPAVQRTRPSSPPSRSRSIGVAFILIAYPASLLIRALERRLVR